jgi:ADP-ribosylglycohydrolase
MNRKNSLSLQQKIYGSIMGTALGDSIGLPYLASVDREEAFFDEIVCTG